MKRLSLGLLSLGLASLAAACSPAGPGPFGGQLAAAIAPASTGFNGTANYNCGGSIAFPVTGTGDSIAIQLQSAETVTLTGGPLVYAGPSNAVTFEPGYGSFVWTAGGSSLTCIRV